MRIEAGYATKPVVLSILFHLFVVTAIMIGWPFLAKPTPTAQPLIIVDVVKLAPKTNLSAQSGKAKVSPEPEQEATRRKPPPPAPPPLPADTGASVTPSPLSKPASQTTEILPETTKAEPKPILKPVATPKPKPKPKKAAQSKTVSIKTPVSRPKRPEPSKQKQASELAKQLNKLAKKSQQKQRTDAMTGVLQNLAEAKLAKEDEKTQKAIAKQDRTSIAESLTNAIGEAVKSPQTASVATLGLSELDRLRAHISSCWQPPIGAKGADQLKVDIQVKLEKDGSVKQAEIADRQRYGSDVLYRAAANSARRAVLDCQPLPLPAEKYQIWKEFIFGFDPKFM
ncbi:MAG: hypothetical protein CMM80_03505 [Rhodospirillaceae bacterium]|nr:hypothetical protein [Rhodospirillaceae bacterium]